MIRFFVSPEEFFGTQCILTGENARHAKVLRLKAGEEVLLCDGQEEEFKRFYAFCQSIGLPTCREETCASEEDIRRVFRATEKKQDVRIMPYKVTQDMLHEAAEKIEAYHSKQK